MDLTTLTLVVTGLGGLALYVIRAELRGDVTRLDGRINTHEAECLQRQRKLDERHATITKTLEHMDGKLDRLMERQMGV